MKLKKNVVEKDIQQAIAVLQSGGLILYPTDTIWGIGCDATNPQAVAKIYEVKKRAASKSLVTLIAEPIWLRDYVANVPIDIDDVLEQYSDKPTTIVYQNVIGLASNALAEDGSAALRICKEKFCYALLKRFKKPIISTSANISEMPSPAYFAEVDEAIKNNVDYIVHYKQNDNTPASSSRIIALNENGVQLIRA